MKLALFLLLFSGIAGASEIRFDPRIGAEVPLDLAFRESGADTRLDSFFGRTPVVLELGYLACINLCSTTRQGAMEALAGIGLAAGRDYTALFVSVDPKDEAAPEQRRDGWHVLTGARSAARLAAAVGFRYAYEEASGEYAHPAGFLLLSPEGRVVQYFGGVRFDARELRRALLDAQAGRSPGLIEQVLLVCFHDPVSGRYSGAILDALRVGAALLLAALAFLAWRRR
ncbi:MAG TPA: SCO family protein [Burkholderiales bacterium]|nr:SCO family protein [Burkholderiales bacterium]